jgi:hypothetical protein
MPAAQRDVIVERAAVFTYIVDLLDEYGDLRADLTGAAGAMQVRAERDSGSTLLATATVTVDATYSTVTATILAATTASYEWVAGWYDLEITTGPTGVERVAEGRATLHRNVTT